MHTARDAWENTSIQRSIFPCNFFATFIYLYAPRSHELLFRVHPGELLIDREVHDRHDFLEGKQERQEKRGRSDGRRRCVSEGAGKHYDTAVLVGVCVRVCVSHKAS